MGVAKIRSVCDIDFERAKRLLETYCNPDNAFAWPNYDADFAPNRLVGADLAAPALLSYPIRSKYLDQLGAKASDYFKLTSAMQEFVEVGGETRFSTLDFNVVESARRRHVETPIEGPQDWQNLIKCFDAATNLKGINSTAVTKILHRKRPDLVPINDSLLRSFYGPRNRSYSELYIRIRQDLGNPETIKRLNRLREDKRGSDGRKMAELRALDIVVWMHMKYSILPS